MPYQGSLVHASQSLGSAMPPKDTEQDFQTETAHWARNIEHVLCSKARCNFSAKRGTNHPSADSEMWYPVDDS